MVTIRSAVKNDIPNIIAMAQSIWPHTYLPILGNAQLTYMLDLFYTQEALTQQMDDGHTFLIAELAARPVGFASFSEELPSVFKIHKLYVLTDVQGKGVGRALVSYINDALTKSGGIRLRLNVNRFNQGAIGFYEKAGFECIAEDDINIGGGYWMNDYVYELAVEDAPLL